MGLASKYLDTIFKRQKLFEFFVILTIFAAVGFRFGGQGVSWFWGEYPFVALLLVSVGLLFSILWVRVEKARTQTIIDEIKSDRMKDASRAAEKIELLTPRQRDIFELILRGRSNKEIMAELSIELSTLKTHINHIYKTLEIASRKEAKALGRSFGAEREQ